MHSSENLRLTDTDGHAGEPGIQPVHHAALLSASLRNNSALCTAVYEGLDRLTVDVGVDVEHSDVAEELRVVLESGLVISLNHLLANFLLDHFLSFDVVGVRIP